MMSAKMARLARVPRSREKPRFFPAVYEVMSAEMAAGYFSQSKSREKPRFFPAIHEVMSAEMAAGHFSQ
jgi:hypothetical protein